MPHAATVLDVRAADVTELARVLRADYCPESLDPSVAKPTVVDVDDGFRAVALPRPESPEPYRSFRLVDAAALGDTLVVTFTWEDGADDGTVFVLPLDGRDVELDVTDDAAVTTFLSHLVEFTLGGPRASWEAARTTPMSPRLAVVRPWASSG